MPPESKYPGVFVEEVPTGMQPIEGVSTSLTAFIGRTRSGPAQMPTSVGSVAEFESRFGALAANCPLTYAIAQFFENGGTDALVVRIVNGRKPITAANLIGPGLEKKRHGIWALERAPHASLIVIPPLAPGVDVPPEVWNAALAYASRHRAFLLVDPPASWQSASDAAASVDVLVTRDSHAALYFPRIVVSDPLHPAATISCAPSGAVAGVYARTDRERHVWKPPAGTAADLRGVTALATPITTVESGILNSLGVNCLRELPGAGRVVWGARTLDGTDGRASEWKYVNVRRLFIYLEQSIDVGTRWVVFEPNDAALWTQVTQQVTQFLLQLWRAGALMGVTPHDAFYARCDRTTMTQDDIDNGRTVIEIGIAPLRPAEFVIVRIQQTRS
jgi:hypothetical protein